MQQIIRAHSPSSSLISSPSSAGASSTLQEGDGVRKSGPIVLLNSNNSKKKGQLMYAVLSERALELHESEKAQRKKKGTKSIVDLSKCFNVSQQNCPKSRSTCVCLLMPDECFSFRGETETETSDWYSSLLFAVISARALRLGRPVFANEFFECVWDVTVWPTQPKLKISPQNPDNSPNICAKLHHLDLKGKKRLCFYPHTIILCNVGIEPALSGLPKSGIPPFRTTDFVEFSRHYIASYGSQEKFFIMRIGRGSPMGSCEAWIQCESEETAADVKNKLADIIRRETEKKQCALLALGNIAKGGGSSPSFSNGTASQQRHHQHHHHALPGTSTTYAAPLTTTAAAVAGAGVPASGTACSGGQMAAASVANGQPAQHSVAANGGGFSHQNRPPPELETISEDEKQQLEQQQQQQFAGAEQRSPATSVSSSSNGAGGAGSGPQQQKRHNHHGHHHLSQSAREKRLELRECKAKVDSLEEEEQRFREQQQQSYCAAAIANGESRWRLHNLWATAAPTTAATASGSLDGAASVAAAGVCTSASGALMMSHSQSRPAYLGCAATTTAAAIDGAKLFRRRGSATSMDSNRSSSLRANKSEQQMECRNWARKSPLEINNNGINDFDIRWINRTDSLNMLGAGAMGCFFYGAEEETEDSGGTLRIPCADGEENNSQENSRSASSLNLSASAVSTAPQAAATTPTATAAPGAGACIVEALVECHAEAGAEELSADDDDNDGPSTQQQITLTALGAPTATKPDNGDDTSTEEEETAAPDDGKAAHRAAQHIDLATVRRRRKQQQKQVGGGQHDDDDDDEHEHEQQQPVAEQQQWLRQRQQQLLLANTESSSQEAADEADQSCCSSSIASSSSVTCREEVSADNNLVTAVSSSTVAAADHFCHSQQQMPNSSVAELAASADPLASSALAHKPASAVVAVDEHDYTTMDKVSCSSDSFSHLPVPQHWDRQHSSIGIGGCCQEEICSCASDSGDSCYSSMANGQLNPRAFSFSSTTDGGGSAGSSGIGCAGTGGATVSATACAARTAATLAGRISGGGCSGRAEGRHWTMASGVVPGMAAAMQQHHRNCAANNQHHHFSPRNHQQQQHQQHHQQMTNSMNGSNMMMMGHGSTNCWPPESSSSSRFSMETSLITPLEEDEKQIGFMDEEERDKLCTEMSQQRVGGGTELRKRAFSLGSKSWITKPFRKLSSTHHSAGSGASSSAHHHHQQQQQPIGATTNTSADHHPHHRQLHNSADSARSCTSSLAGSVHADLSTTPADQLHNSSSQTRLSHRLGSTSSFASCSITGHQNRSDSVGSSHSVAFSLPGGGSSLLTQKLLRKKQPSDDHFRSDDLVELEFMPQKKQQQQFGGVNGTPAAMPVPFLTNFTHHSAQCVPTTVNEDALRSSPRARTSSCDEHNNNSQQHHHCQQQLATLHQLHQAKSTPLTTSRTSASIGAAFDRSVGTGGSRHQSHQQQPQQQQQRHHHRAWTGTTVADQHTAERAGTNATRWTSQDHFPTICQQPQQQQQKLRPSESFIRSIQQQQQELKQQQQKNTSNTIPSNSRMHRRQKKRSDFPLQEVQCFIAPAEREKIDAVTARSDRDSLSMRSQRSGSGSTFETIQECGGSVGPKRDSRTSIRHPSSRPPSSIASADSQQKLHQIVNNNNTEEDEYILSSKQ